MTQQFGILLTALKDEYNHLFGQLSGHVYTAIDTKIDKKVENVSATITALVDDAQQHNETATKTFENECKSPFVFDTCSHQCQVIHHSHYE